MQTDPSEKPSWNNPKLDHQKPQFNFSCLPHRRVGHAAKDLSNFFAFALFQTISCWLWKNHEKSTCCTTNMLSTIPCWLVSYFLILHHNYEPISFFAASMALSIFKLKKSHHNQPPKQKTPKRLVGVAFQVQGHGTDPFLRMLQCLADQVDHT